MLFGKPERTELVLSMTLAEIFLLLLFVVWYGTGIDCKNCERDKMLLIAKLERAEERIQKLTTELNQANEKITDLEQKLEAWRKLTGLENPPSSKGELKEKICRSSPKCEEENNILVHARVIDGQIAMKIISESPRLAAWFAGEGYTLPALNVSVTNTRVIHQFLDRIRAFYNHAQSDQKECRFDYRLTYKTEVDYYNGRELFERYFYPERISRVNQNSN